MKGVTISNNKGAVFPTTIQSPNGKAIASAFKKTHIVIAIKPIKVCLAEGRVRSFKFWVRLSTPILSFLFIVN